MANLPGHNLELILAFAAAVLLAAVIMMVLSGRRDREERRRERDAMQRELQRLAETAERLTASQGDISGRLQQSHADVNQRLDTMGKRLGDGLHQQSERTGRDLKTLHERLAVIDAAQRNITELSEQMVGLQDILSNKQARGAFGEIQMQDIVTAALPPSAYEFQASLGNNRRVDCLLKLPNPPGPIAIDSKFPLESFRMLRDAEDGDARIRAGREFAADVGKHVRDIQERYIVASETAESALMFLPSEAVYAELHANFVNVVEDSYRRRVWIVSPTTLMATLNTVRAVLKDARMREQAGVIQTEVHRMLEDVGRLDKRVGNLQRHFGQAEEDLREIRISADKVTKRGERIDELQFDEEGPEQDLEPPREPQQPRLKSV